MSEAQIRLTSLAHGGGCGCKLAPSILQELLANQAGATPFAKLLVGTETGDDAAVWQLDANTCVVATTDFFMPIVDDPFDFGRIAATNAISDVYAMGANPIMALAILGIPLGKLSTDIVRDILARRQRRLRGGGHSLLPAVTRSIVLSPSTAWLLPASARLAKSGAIAGQDPATRSS